MSQVLEIKWNKNTFTLQVSPSISIFELKQIIQTQTQIPPYFQKLCGLLPKGKIPEDNVILSTISTLKNPQKILLIGISQQEVEKNQTEELILKEQLEIQRKLEAEEEERENQRRETYRKEMEERRKKEEEERILREQEYQRRMEEERRLMLQQEIAMENDMDAVLKYKLQCFSSTVASKPSMEKSDKINHRLALPLIFELTNPANPPSKEDSFPKIAHAGVLDFTAPPNMIYVPIWMMNKLNLSEGEPVSFMNVHLPKGEFVQLQPHSRKWLDLEQSTRKSVLEFELPRNFQSLTLGDTIKIEHEGETYLFNVIQTQPSPAISITDTDLAFDIIEPIEQMDEVKEKLELDKPIKDSVNNEEYKFYDLTIEDPNIHLLVEVHTLKGDTSLYVSQAYQKPTQFQYTWISQHIGENSITLNQKDSNLELGQIYIGVQGNQNESQFELIIKKIPKEIGHSLQQGNSSMEGGIRCHNCQKFVPEASFQMHQLNCSKRNYFCEKCRVVIPINEKEKHLSLVHTMLQCECGVKQLEQNDLHLHKEFECTRRKVKCLYCPLKIPLNERGSHQEICGSRTVTCKYCSEILKRKEMKFHLKKNHQIDILDITQSGEIEHTN